MRHTRFHFRQKQAPIRPAPGARPSLFTLVVLALLAVSILLVGMGIMALLLAPFAILIGISLLTLTLSLLCLVGIAKGCLALARGIARWVSRWPACSSLSSSFIFLQIYLARMLASWLANWLANHDSGPPRSGASSTSSHQTRVSSLLEGARW
jgi:hypothetical protein